MADEKSKSHAEYKILPARMIRAIYSVLLLLANRVLPSESTETKVAALMRHFERYWLPIEDARKKVAARFPEADKNLAQRLALEAAIERLNATTFKVRIPRSKIQESDFPKALKSDDGDANRAAVAAIKKDLHFLWAAKEEEIEAKDETDLPIFDIGVLLGDVSEGDAAERKHQAEAEPTAEAIDV